MLSDAPRMCTIMLSFSKYSRCKIIDHWGLSDGPFRSSSPMLVSFKNRRLSFEVVVRNVKENAYNTKIITTYSKSLFYASVTPPVSTEKLLLISWLWSSQNLLSSLLCQNLDANKNIINDLTNILLCKMIGFNLISSNQIEQNTFIAPKTLSYLLVSEWWNACEMLCAGIPRVSSSIPCTWEEPAGMLGKLQHASKTVYLWYNSLPTLLFLKVRFFIHFDFNLNHLQSNAQVDFTAQRWEKNLRCLRTGGAVCSSMRCADVQQPLNSLSCLVALV